MLLGQAGSISIGAATVENAKVGIMKTLPRCIGEGVVGYDFLRHYVLTIDHAQNKLTFALPEERKADDQMQYVSMPLKIPRVDRPLVLVDVVVDTQATYQFVLDTGASQTVVSPALAEREGVMSNEGGPLIGAAGAVTGSSGMLRSLRIGDTSIQNVRVMISDAFSPVTEAVGTTIDGILGYNVLRRFRIILNYPNGKIQFGRPQTDMSADGKAG